MRYQQVLQFGLFALALLVPTSAFAQFNQREVSVSMDRTTSVYSEPNNNDLILEIVSAALDSVSVDDIAEPLPVFCSDEDMFDSESEREPHFVVGDDRDNWISKCKDQFCPHVIAADKGLQSAADKCRRAATWITRRACWAGYTIAEQIKYQACYSICGDIYDGKGPVTKSDVDKYLENKK